MKCKICGAEYSEPVSKCEYCGNDMESDSISDYYEMMENSKQKNNRPDNLYCTKCGRTLNMETYKCDFCDGPSEKPISEVTAQKEPVPTAQTKKDTYEKAAYIKEPKTHNTYHRPIVQTTGSNMDKKKSRKSDKKKISIKKIVLIVLGLMLLFAVSVGAFYVIIEHNLNKGKEPVQTIEPIATIDSTPSSEPEESLAPTSKPTQKPARQTEKPSEPTRKPTEKPADPTLKPSQSMSDALYPTDERVITESELEDLSRQEIKLIYYEIYARYGMTFDDDDLVEFFEGRRGYVPTETDEEKVEAMFNDTEKKNIEVIEEYQRKQGWRQ